MKDDKIRLLMTEISDKYIDRYREILDKKAAEAAAAEAAAEGNARAAGTAAGAGAGDSAGTVRTGRGGRQHLPFVWRAIAAGVAVLFFLAGGLLLGKFMRQGSRHDPAVSPEITALPAETPTPAPEETWGTPATTDATGTPTGLPPETDIATGTPVFTPDVSGTGVQTPELTPTGAATSAATPALTSTPSSGITATPEVTATATATAAVTATPVATATATATPEVTATATPSPGAYIATRLEQYLIICENEPELNSLNEYEYESGVITSFIRPESLYITGYAYNSESPLKEVFYRINDDPAEHVCAGNFRARNDVAQEAGYSVDNAARSGFGTVVEPLQLTGLDLTEGIYKLRIIARFENGAEAEIASPALVIDVPEEPRYEFNPEYISVNLPIPGGSGFELPYDTGEFFPLLDGSTSRDLGWLNLSLFSHCEIDYYTAPDWLPFAEGSMTEPAFISLKQGTAEDVRNDGADKSRVLAWTTLAAPSPSDPPHPIYSGSLVRRTAVIDLSDCAFSDLSPVSLSAYPSTSGPVYLSGMRLYFRTAP
ncbi:MAG: hypothetical protein II184_08200 [Clostridia bacterium]|nr:hypothetical protein [Clostridia bacterium]